MMIFDCLILLWSVGFDVRSAFYGMAYFVLVVWQRSAVIFLVAFVDFLCLSLSPFVCIFLLVFWLSMFCA